MAVSAFRAPLLVLALGGCAAAAGDRGTARLVDRVWLDIGGDAAPGSFRAFLSDGTLMGCAESQSSGAIWFWKPGEAEPFHAVGGQSVYEVDVRPDGMAVAGAFFAQIGKQGNGRGDKKGEYVANGGQIRMFGLYEKPKPPPKAKPKK